METRFFIAALSDKDGLQCYVMLTSGKLHRDHHSNKMTSLFFSLAALFLDTGRIFSQSLTGAFSSMPAPMFVRFEQNLWERFRDIW